MKMGCLTTIFTRSLAMVVCVAMALALMPGLTAAAEKTTNGLEYKSYYEYVEITKYSGNAESVAIPSQIDGMPVTAIAWRAFYNCENVTSVSIPNSVKTIGRNAFEGCTGIRNIIIPDSVTTVEDWAFISCRGLTGITFGNGVATIGKNVFEGCTSLQSVILGNNLTSIGPSAFAGCVSLTSIALPNKLTFIGDSAFNGCKNLASVTIPNSLTTIGDSVFSGCTSLTNVTIPSSVTNLGCHAFAGCTALEAITIPDSVTTIGDGVFSGCTGLVSAVIGDGLDNTGISTFQGCTNLKNVVIGKRVNTIHNHSFRDCTNLTSIVIPVSVTAVGYYAFKGCDNIANVYYDSSEKDWAKIEINRSEQSNASLSNATIHYNGTGRITSGDGISVSVNGIPIIFDVPPIAISGTTMLPVRLALEPLGAKFIWNGERQTVTINARGKTIVLTINSDIAYVDDVAKTMAQPAMAIDGRTLIPIRFVAETLGYDVNWDGNTQTVIIKG